MSTFMAKKEEIRRKWYLIDAAGKPLGKVAVLAATVLNGKRKPEYTPNVDCGDCVVVVNAAEAVLTGRKPEQKVYYHHSGYISGLKAVKYSVLMATKPEKAVYLAVKGMLPKNKIGAASLTRLKVYRGGEHKQQSQKPETLEVK